MCISSMHITEFCRISKLGKFANRRIYMEQVHLQFLFWVRTRFSINCFCPLERERERERVRERERKEEEGEEEDE